MDRAGESGIVVPRFTSVNHRPPSSSGLGRLPFTQVTRVQIPLGVLAVRRAPWRPPLSTPFPPCFAADENALAGLQEDPSASLRENALAGLQGDPSASLRENALAGLKDGADSGAFGVRGLNAPPKGMRSLQPDHRQSPEAGEGSAPISGRAADGALAALCPFVSLALLVAAYASVSLGGVLAIERQHHRVKVRQFALHG